MITSSLNVVFIISWHLKYHSVVMIRSVTVYGTDQVMFEMNARKNVNFWLVVVALDTARKSWGSSMMEGQSALLLRWWRVVSQQMLEVLRRWWGWQETVSHQLVHTPPYKLRSEPRQIWTQGLLLTLDQLGDLLVCSWEVPRWTWRRSLPPSACPPDRGRWRPSCSARRDPPGYWRDTPLSQDNNCWLQSRYKWRWPELSAPSYPPARGERGQQPPGPEPPDCL